MKRVTIGPELSSKLEMAFAQIELCDHNGKTIGVFLPMEFYHALTRMRNLACANTGMPFSEEEIAKLRSEKEGSSLADFWKRLINC
jgi:hypothetical protein